MSNETIMAERMFAKLGEIEQSLARLTEQVAKLAQEVELVRQAWVYTPTPYTPEQWLAHIEARADKDFVKEGT